MQRLNWISIQWIVAVIVLILSAIMEWSLLQNIGSGVIFILCIKETVRDTPEFNNNIIKLEEKIELLEAAVKRIEKDLK